MNPDMSRVARRDIRISALILLLIAAGLARQWPDHSLWYDETVNAYFAGRPWSDLWEWCTEIDNQMPLDFALRKLWGGAVGTSEWSLRAFSFMGVLFAAAGVMALARGLSSRASAGWLAALAFILTQSTLYAVFEVRPYALALALFAWSSVFLWAMWQQYGEQAHPLDGHYVVLLLTYLLLALALIYTHYTGFMALAAHGVYVVGRALMRRSRQKVMILTHLAAGMALGYLPWMLALAGRDVRAGTAYADQITPRLALKTYVEFYAHGQNLVPDTAPPYAWLAVGLILAVMIVGVAMVRRAGARLRGLLFAAALLVIPLVGLLVMVYAVQAKLSGRHGWPMWIGAAVLIGVGLGVLDRARWLRWIRWPVWGAALLIVALPARVETRPIYDSYLREAFDVIHTQSRPGDVLVLRDGTLFTAAGYYDAPIPWIGLPDEPLTDVNRFLFFDEAIDRLRTLIRANDARRVWVVAWQGDIMDPQNLVGGILTAIGDPVPVVGGFGDVSVALYKLRSGPNRVRQQVAALRPLAQVPPDGPVCYGGYILNADPLPPGGTLYLHTWWQRGARIVPGLRVSVRLVDAAGHYAAQIDQPPVSMTFGQEHWQPSSPILSQFTLLVPLDMSLGPAEVRLILYDVDGSFAPVEVVIDQFTIVE